MSSKSFPLPDAPPLAAQTGEQFQNLVAVMQRLLAEDGCAWDRAQTFQSLRKYVLEEACEVIDAIDASDWELLQEELGDLALQVAFLSEMARTRLGFGPDDVLHGICEKLIRRHPHVFADAEATDPEAVARQWEEIKAQEKPRSTRLLGRIPRALPALDRAVALSKKAAQVGFDWPDARGSRAKVLEELDEVDEAVEGKDQPGIEAELGDLLFAVVNLSRHHAVDPSRALQAACDKFSKRFSHVEDAVLDQRGDWPRSSSGKPKRGVPLAQLETAWTEAKLKETR